MKKARMIAAAAAAVVSASALALSAGAYNAYIAFQTNQYTFRNDWNEVNYGKATPYFNNLIVWGQGDNPEESYPDYEDDFNYDIGGYVIPAKYSDATITADGTYTVSADANFHVREDDDYFRMIFVSTDIPTDENVKITNVKLSMDGKVVKTIDEYAYDPETMYVGIFVANEYAPEVGAWKDSYPDKSMSIEFTVSGFKAASDAQAATESKDAPAPTTGDTTAATTSSKGSPDTGVADVAVIGGLALAAGAGIVLTRKRK